MTIASGSNGTRLAHLILRSLGIAPALVMAACGGKVVVDDSDAESSGSGGGEGGSGSTTSAGNGNGGSSSTTTPTSTGTGPEPWCAQPGTYACIQPSSGGCPPAGSQQALDELGKLLNTSEECTDIPGCWCSTEVSAVPCGPDPTAVGQCCYVAQVDIYEQLCEGRPFTVEGHARTATLASRRDWMAELAVDAAALDDDARRAIADAWARDALYEHASVASFARFALELLAVGAPAALVRDAQRAMGDEIRHAELAFSLAAAFGGAPLGPSTLPIERSLDERADLASIAAAVVREGCVGETLAALVALAARDGASHPCVRAALDEISRDESEHAALAWRFVGWALEHGGAEVRAAVETAFAEARANLSPEAAEVPPSGVDAAILRAHGRVPLDEQRAIFARGLDEVVLPCARALLSPSRRVERGCEATI